MAARGGTTIKLRHDKVRVAKLETDGHISKREYERKLDKLGIKMREILQAYLFSGDRGVVVFEGVDAAGKGGSIRRLTTVLDPRAYKVWPIGPPNEIERQQHYLTRFWSRLPPHGTMAVFDRSWYGRVLVERVEGYAEKREWRRAYNEINEFEHMLLDDGVKLVKIFLHISQKEQLKRFEQRVRDPLKRWKLTYDDIRNRLQWEAYEEAIDEMIERTSTVAAPWHVVATDNKRRARIETLTHITNVLSKGVDLKPRPLAPKLRDALEDAFGIGFDQD
jgi:polyphosphate kinase 2 (PPK2 family)